MVDDQELVAHGVAMLLSSQPDLRVIGPALTADEAVVVARRERPDVTVLDVRMPGTGGPETVPALVAAGTRVLMLTSFPDLEAVRASLEAGAVGFLLKDRAPAMLCDAVRAVAGGDGWLDPTVTPPLLAALARAPRDDEARARLSHLTSREREVLQLLAQGRSNREIAGELFLAESTVKTHVTAILRQVGVRDRLQAAVLAVRAGLGPDE